MPAKFQRPPGFPYQSQTATVHATFYETLTQENKPIAAQMLDGEINRLIDGLNETWVALQGTAAGIVPGANELVNQNKVLVANGTMENPLAWAQIGDNQIQNGSISLGKLRGGTANSVVGVNAQGGLEAVAGGPGSVLQFQGNQTPTAVLPKTLFGNWTAANTVLRSDGTNIQFGKVQTADLTDGCVTTTQIAHGAVQTAQVADGAITGTKIADASVDSPKIISLDAAKLTGVLAADRLPGLDADRIIAGTLGTDRLPVVPLAKLPALPGTQLQDLTIPAAKMVAPGVPTGSVLTSNPNGSCSWAEPQGGVWGYIVGEKGVITKQKGVNNAAIMGGDAGVTFNLTNLPNGKTPAFISSNFYSVTGNVKQDNGLYTFQYYVPNSTTYSLSPIPNWSLLIFAV